jgi:selenide,water dikinase
VGTETADDAGVYKLTDELAVVMTADFITPPVDDPYVFGQIAAANALSDVYAMGGRPVACLNLVAFPSACLEPEVLERIIAGALSKVQEAGATLAGGHSTEDDEPKFGLSVTGVVHPDKIWRNCGAREGDQLILTKPIGSGVLINAQRKGWAPEAAMDACVKLITTLNRTAAEVMANHEIHAATDVTGFGLAGHGFECAKGAGLTFQFEMGSVPIMEGSLEMYERGVSTGVNKANRELVEGHYRFDAALPEWHREIVFDPQTAGGLLVAVPSAQAQPLLDDLHKAGVTHARRIGEVRPREKELLVFA